jgi:hypothetical protein
MGLRISWLAFAVAFGFFTNALAAPFDARSRTVSSSAQVLVYCQNADLRTRAASLAEDIKSQLLGLFGETDQWRFPVVVSIEPAATDPAVIRLNLVDTPDGMSVQLQVRPGPDPAEVHLEKHLLRALLLERMYRRRDRVRAGDSYLEAPRWLVEGVLVFRRFREGSQSLSQYRLLLGTRNLLPVEEILENRVELLGSPTAEAMDAVYAYCLLRLLMDQPEGRACLVRLLEDWPDCGDAPVSALGSHFPALGSSPDALRKWWTLGVARLAVSAEGTMLDAGESEKYLVRLLQVEVVVNAEGKRTRFELEQFGEFLPLPDARRALQAAQAAMLEAGSRVHFLFQPVLAQYEMAIAELLAGKKRGVAEKIRKADLARLEVRQRLDGIADLLNHYEATQMKGFSGAFGGLLKTAPARPPAVPGGKTETVPGAGPAGGDLLPPK